MPTAVASSLTVKPCSGTWHMPHDMVPLRDRRRSMNSLRPSAMRSAAGRRSPPDGNPNGHPVSQTGAGRDRLDRSPEQRDDAAEQ